MKKVMLIFGIILAIAILAFAGYALHAYMATRLPVGTVINGIEVGNCTPATATARIGENLNHIKVQSSDAEAEIDACFTYDENVIKNLVKSAAFDPRVKEDLTSGKVTIDMRVTGGYKKTADVLRGAKLSPEDKRAHDAYINLKDMMIVEEEYGNELNYKRLSKGLAKYLQEHATEDPANREFKFSTKKYSIQPLVKSDNKSLNDELMFDKEYIAGGLNVKYDDGSFVTMSVEELAKIIKYSKSGPKYYRSGAMEVAKKYAQYKPSEYTVIFNDKPYTIVNNGLIVHLDEEKTSEALYQAAAAKQDAELTMDMKTGEPYSSMLAIKDNMAYVINASGSSNSETAIKCEISDAGEGIYMLSKEQPNAAEGVLYIDGGGTIKAESSLEAVFENIQNSDTKEAYVAVIYQK